MSALLEAIVGTYDVVMDAGRQRLRTMTPVVVQAWTAPATRGASCDAVLPIPDQAPNGDPISSTNSLITARPVYYPSGGGWTVHYPLSSGDEVLALAADRNTEAWALNREPGAPSNAAIPRWHDISDAAILAMQDRPPLPSPTPTGLGTDLLITHRTGGVLLRCEPSGKVTITASSTVAVVVDPAGKVTITAPLVEVAGADDFAVKYASLVAAVDALLLAGVNAAGPGAANFSAATTSWNSLKTTVKSNKVKVGS
jgi:hypothetical protein